MRFKEGTPTPLRLLIVEDDAALVASLGERFALDGHICDFAADGQSALALISRADFDVMLLDVSLPRFDGLVATCSVGTGNSVAMTGTDGNCDYSDTDLYGGWGWNAVASQNCAPLENVSDIQPTAQCIDTDGDGYGWNGTASCIP